MMFMASRGQRRGVGSARSGIYRQHRLAKTTKMSHTPQVFDMGRSARGLPQTMAETGGVQQVKKKSTHTIIRVISRRHSRALSPPHSATASWCILVFVC